MSNDERAHDRRVDDRDRMLNDRLDNMERDHRALVTQVTALESKLNIVQLEQSHLKDLFDARLKVIEKQLEHQLSETKAIAQGIQRMGDSAQNTPAGRAMQGELAQVRATQDEQGDTLKAHAAVHETLKDWQKAVDGVLIIMKWVGAGGLIALGISVLRLLKMLP